MATGANIQPGRGIQVSNLPLQADMRTGDAQAWESAREVADRLYEAGKPNLIRRAQVRGMAEGNAIAAGEREYKADPLAFGQVAQAREQALQAAYLARVRVDIDARDDELRNAHRYDPEAYQKASGEAVSGFIRGAPPEFAVEVENYARSRAQNSLSAIASARSQRDEQEVNQSLAVRIATLDERMIALAAQPDGMNSPEYAGAQLERSNLQDERARNPAILYSEDQRLADDDKLEQGVLSANVSRLAVEVYQDNGRGLPGYAAATRFLNDEVLNGEAFSRLTPEGRQAVFRDGQRQLRDFAAVDREDQRVADERERADRERRREIVGDLKLDILLGGVSEADIRGREDLTDADKASLLTTARTQQRREQADARREQADARREQRDVYNGYADEARAGTLTTSELAEAVQSGLVTAGQARTLRTIRDRTLGPVVRDVLAPVRDAARGPGRSRRGNATAMAQAEEHAANWAVANPNATLQERIEFGKFVAETVFGGRGAGRPANQQAAQTQQAAQLQALEAERQRRGRAMSTAEYNRRRTEIMHGS